jgi:hypothetical protein
MKNWKRLAVVPVILFSITACGQSTDHDMHKHQLSNGDLQEKTMNASVLPTFLDDKNKQIQQIYSLAAANTDLLQWIPCYCGCGESAGHTSNKDCFVSKMDKDGAVIWDDHGTRCGVCMEIAAYSIKMKQEGKSVKEIRTFIDTKYNKGYAKPTDTPMPI